MLTTNNTSGCMVDYMYVCQGNCPKCGKPFSYIGDVPEHGWPKGQSPICTCNEDTPFNKNFLTYGWRCPVCGDVNAPWVSKCNGYHGVTNTISTSNYTIKAE